MQYLLDTNACIRCLRKPTSTVAVRLSGVPRTAVVLCATVAAELYRGAEMAADPPKEEAKVDAFIAAFRVLDFNLATARVHARIRAHLDRLGTPIGPYDLMIAATGLAHGLTVVTHNTAHFARVPGLMIVDWEIP